MFDFTPVGATIAVLGVAFLAFGYKLLPHRRGAASLDAAFNIKGYTTEAGLPAESPLVGKTVADLEQLGDGEVEVSTIIRERFRRYTPSPSWKLIAGDVLLLEGEPAALERLVALGNLRLAAAEDEGAVAAPVVDAENFGVMEAVVTSDSPLIDKTVAQAGLGERHEIGLLAVSRQGERLARRLRTIKSRPAT
jgi:di/tricarboxylate transporter